MGEVDFFTLYDVIIANCRQLHLNTRSQFLKLWITKAWVRQRNLDRPPFALLFVPHSHQKITNPFSLYERNSHGDGFACFCRGPFFLQGPPPSLAYDQRLRNGHDRHLQEPETCSQEIRDSGRIPTVEPVVDCFHSYPF